MRRKTIKCTCAEDLKQLIHEYYFKHLLQKVRQQQMSKNDYNKEWVKLPEMAEKQWQKLQNNKKNKYFMEKYGYLNITYKEGKCVRVPFAKGHPKVEDKAKKKVTVRLKNDEYDKLQDVCTAGKFNQSEIIRMALNKYLSDKSIKQIAFDLTYGNK